MLLLGIDPGLAATGWGLVHYEQSRYILETFGVIKTSSRWEAPDRLLKIYDEIKQVSEQYSVREAGIETLYFAKNVKSALPVAEARGVLLLALKQRGMVLKEYTPLQIKQAVVGNGMAEKKQVQTMVAFMLGLKAPPRPDHAADALAAAICHGNWRNSYV